MKPNFPLELHHSWSLADRAQHFALGHLHTGQVIEFPGSAKRDDHPKDGATGAWQCDLRDNRLHWADDVYDIFGLPRGAAVSRDEAVALYCEESRAAMETLRAYAIRHQRGFTIDVRIRPGQGEYRWIRLIAAPICEGDRVVALHGLKRILPASPR